MFEMEDPTGVKIHGTVAKIHNGTKPEHTASTGLVPSLAEIHELQASPHCSYCNATMMLILECMRM